MTTRKRDYTNLPLTALRVENLALRTRIRAIKRLLHKHLDGNMMSEAIKLRTALKEAGL